MSDDFLDMISKIKTKFKKNEIATIQFFSKKKKLCIV